MGGFQHSSFFRMEIKTASYCAPTQVLQNPPEQATEKSLRNFLKLSFGSGAVGSGAARSQPRFFANAHKKREPMWLPFDGTRGVRPKV